MPIHIVDSIIVYVNTKAPTLAPLFRSNAQGEILARLFLNPETSFTISELARAASTPYASAHREVSRIAEMGLATTEKRGQAVEVQARRDTPIFRPLAELLGLTYGPAVVIPTHLAGIGGISEAYIYGSWAARREGEPGDSPGDIDLLIVGNPSRREVYDAARIAGISLRREVNLRIVSTAAWEAADADPFLRTLTKRPLIPLDLQETPS
ncbi:nucleotidyltransferase domain-containing protein [Cryobacterium fucosi]|uniref:Nucleotidyltransferase domain-containing protein n=1 Tax=Cryobacterium fucosi TaxID=1259157 RepID=A0A4R9AZL2_9MICO|nr:nucleotidyltransferase domain-containing protein [Cryobacterium fucosi]TFD73269.1 nucleotidyltransferase domain-containing protein [Cryobacterium fucosi]